MLSGLYSQSDGRAVSAAIVVLSEIQKSFSTTLRINIVLAVAGVGCAAGAVGRGGHDLSGECRIEKKLSFPFEGLVSRGIKQADHGMNMNCAA